VSLDLSLGPFLDLLAGLSLDPVRFQLLPLRPRRDHRLNAVICDPESHNPHMHQTERGHLRAPGTL